MATPKEWKRLSFQEALELIPLTDKDSKSQTEARKFMSRQPAWVPGNELPWETIGADSRQLTRGAYGGVVYAQAPLAAARVVEQEDRESGDADNGTKRGIHVSSVSVPGPASFI